MPTGARGEATFESGGESYTLLYNNRALADAENRTGKGIIEIMQDARERKLSIGDTAEMLVAGLEAARRDAHTPHKPYTLEHAFRILDDLGFMPVFEIVMEGVMACIQYTRGDEDDAEEPNPQTA